jgi:hypothetical protein
MYNDKRKSHRHPIRYSAWIELPNGKLYGCALADISDHGARLELDSPEKIPDNFSLLLSNRGRPRRRCKIAWRKKHQIGVSFERPLAHPDRHKVVRKLASGELPMQPEPEQADDPHKEPA